VYCTRPTAATGGPYLHQSLNESAAVGPTILGPFGQRPCHDIALKLGEKAQFWGLAQMSGHDLQRASLKRQSSAAQLAIANGK
jgi:hypothetical protein